MMRKGTKVVVHSGVYRGRTGKLAEKPGQYWSQVRPDQMYVGGLNPNGNMVVGASEFARRTK